MNRLDTEKRAQIVGSLVESNSVGATVRMTGAAKNTVVKLVVDLGAACASIKIRSPSEISTSYVERQNLPCEWACADCPV